MINPAPITAYVGGNGTGKTLSAIAYALTDQARHGRQLVTNVAGVAVPHVYVTSVEDLPDLLDELGSCNIVLDEAGAMFAARDTGRNKAFEKTVQQLRKFDARMLWTAPAFARADKILREVTFMVVLCRSLRQKQIPGKAWPSTRLIMQKAFDVSRLDTSGMSINKNARAKGFALVRTARWQSAFDSFSVAGRALAPAPGVGPSHRAAS